MAVSDIRIACTFREHPKRRKLQKLLGAEGVLAFIDLMIFTGQYRPEGVLYDMTPDEIAEAVNWRGESDKLIKALLQCHLLDNADGALRLHDWEEHNKWAFNFKSRSEASKRAIARRWEKRLQKMANNTERNTDSNTVGNTIGNTPRITECNTPGNTDGITERNTQSNTNSNMERNTERNTECNTTRIVDGNSQQKYPLPLPSALPLPSPFPLGRDPQVMTENRHDTSPKKRKVSEVLSDQEFIDGLRQIPRYQAILDKEIDKMRAYKLTPKGEKKIFTKQRILNWLNTALNEAQEVSLPNKTRPMTYLEKIAAGYSEEEARRNN